MRAKFLIASAAVVLLSGCLSPEEQAKLEQDRSVHDTEQCVGLGANTDYLMYECRMSLRRERIARSEAESARWAAFSQQMLNPPRQEPSPPPQAPTMRTTTCQQAGVMVTCNTF
jgi:hypothetical protein